MDDEFGADVLEAAPELSAKQFAWKPTAWDSSVAKKQLQDVRRAYEAAPPVVKAVGKGVKDFATIATGDPLGGIESSLGWAGVQYPKVLKDTGKAAMMLPLSGSVLAKQILAEGGEAALRHAQALADAGEAIYRAAGKSVDNVRPEVLIEAGQRVLDSQTRKAMAPAAREALDAAILKKAEVAAAKAKQLAGKPMSATEIALLDQPNRMERLIKRSAEVMDNPPPLAKVEQALENPMADVSDELWERYKNALLEGRIDEAKKLQNMTVMKLKDKLWKGK